jgi:Transposase, Mutator family
MVGGFLPNSAKDIGWLHCRPGAAGLSDRTVAADALIASCYLSGTNTRRVRRALRALFGGAVGKDPVSWVWRKVKSDWEAWNSRSLAHEPIVRLSFGTRSRPLFAGRGDIPDDCLAAFVDVHVLDTDLLRAAMPEFS